jgi:hypothetical protein
MSRRFYSRRFAVFFGLPGGGRRPVFSPERLEKERRGDYSICHESICSTSELSN